MSDIAVLVRDFELGTRIADMAANLDMEITFLEGFESVNRHVSERTHLVIVDLNDEEFHPLDLTRRIRTAYPELPIVGFLAQVRKRLHDRAKEAGCTWVLPRSSLVQNLPRLIEKGLTGGY